MARLLFFGAELICAEAVTFLASRALFPALYRITFGVFPGESKEKKFVTRSLVGSFFVMLTGITVTELVFIPVSGRIPQLEGVSLVSDFLPAFLFCICSSAAGLFCDFLKLKGKSAFVSSNAVCAAATVAFLASFIALQGPSFRVFIPFYGFVVSAPLFWVSGIAASFVHVGTVSVCDKSTCLLNFACVSFAVLAGGLITGNIKGILFGICFLGASLTLMLLPVCFRDCGMGEKLFLASLAVAGVWIFRCPLMLLPLSLQPAADKICDTVKGKTLYSYCLEKYSGKALCILPSALLSLAGALISVILIYFGYAE